MTTTKTRSRITAESLSRLVENHQAGLWRFLVYLGAEPELAEDIVQEVFLYVWRRPFEDRGRAAVSAYLRRVARHRFIDACRRRRARPALRDLSAAEAVWCEMEADDEGDDYRRLLRECLEGLTDRARRILELFYREGRSRVQVARALSMAADGVKTAMRRARATLRDCVERKRAHA